jgi:NAD(P)H-flavin reductase
MATPRSAELPPAPGPMVPERFRVLGKRRDTEDTWTLELEAAQGGPGPSFEPGQFNMVYAFGAGEVPISICGDPAGDGPLAHTVRSVGATTAAICDTAAGDVLGVRGPFGSAWPLESAEDRDLVVIAGGIGLAPLRPALLSALRRRERFNRVILLYGGRTPAQLLYRDELRRWAADGAEVAVTVDSASGGWNGRVGVVTQLLDRAALDPAETVAMLCGPEVMMRFAIHALGQLGVDAAEINVSIERNMKCAITQCGRCQFGPTFACREGPVMRLSDIEPFFAMREV